MRFSDINKAGIKALDSLLVKLAVEIKINPSKSELTISKFGLIKCLKKFSRRI